MSSPLPNDHIHRFRLGFPHIFKTVFFVLTVSLCVVIGTLLSSATDRADTIGAEDELALSRDWLFQSRYADLEFHEGEPARWLLNQPKKSFSLINRAIDDSLLHAATTLVARTSTDAFASYTLRLATPIGKPISVTGATRTISFALMPGTRTYTLLTEPNFVPVQTRLLPISTSAFESYGFSTTQYTQSTTDTRELIADFRSATFRNWSPSATAIWMWVLIALPLLLFAAPPATSTHWWDAPLSVAIIVTPWLVSVLSGTAPSIEPVVTFFVCGALIVSRRLADFFGVRTSPYATPVWVMALLASCLSGTRALAVSHWMLGVDFAAMPTWSDFGVYIASMRAAFPIPLLAVEYLLSRSDIPLLFDVLYATAFVRFCAIAGILAALSIIPKTTLWWRWSTYLLGIVLCLGVAFVYRYDDRNYWMAYDACIGLALVVVFLLLRSPLDRPVQWLGLGVAVVAADSLRPYMQVVLPVLIGVGMVRIGRSVGWRGVRWFLLPLCISIVWHLHHIIQLGQWSWSNYAGFNIARAWVPEAYAQAVIGLPSDMNHPEWGSRSGALIRATVAWIVAHPVDALRNGLSLLTEMFRIPVTIRRFGNDGSIYEVIRVVPWYVGIYQTIATLALVGHGLFLVNALVRRPTLWAQYTIERVIWITVVCMTALSETGEQARFIASYIPLLFLGITDARAMFDWDALRLSILHRFSGFSRKK
ncbi:MAG: hypothetical protein RLY87_539 [Chloroflexota bacterium]